MERQSPKINPAYVPIFKDRESGEDPEELFGNPGLIDPFRKIYSYLDPKAKKSLPLVSKKFNALDKTVFSYPPHIVEGMQKYASLKKMINEKPLVVLRTLLLTNKPGIAKYFVELFRGEDVYLILWKTLQGFSDQEEKIKRKADKEERQKQERYKKIIKRDSDSKAEVFRNADEEMMINHPEDYWGRSQRTSQLPRDMIREISNYLDDEELIHFIASNPYVAKQLFGTL